MDGTGEHKQSSSLLNLLLAAIRTPEVVDTQSNFSLETCQRLRKITSLTFLYTNTFQWGSTVTAAAELPSTADVVCSPPLHCQLPAQPGQLALPTDTAHLLRQLRAHPWDPMLLGAELCPSLRAGWPTALRQQTARRAVMELHLLSLLCFPGPFVLFFLCLFFFVFVFYFLLKSHCY